MTTADEIIQNLHRELAEIVQNLHRQLTVEQERANHYRDHWQDAMSRIRQLEQAGDALHVQFACHCNAFDYTCDRCKKAEEQWCAAHPDQLCSQCGRPERANKVQCLQCDKEITA